MFELKFITYFFIINFKVLVFFTIINILFKNLLCQSTRKHRHDMRQTQHANTICTQAQQDMTRLSSLI